MKNALVTQVTEVRRELLLDVPVDAKDCRARKVAGEVGSPVLLSNDERGHSRFAARGCERDGRDGESIAREAVGRLAGNRHNFGARDGLQERIHGLLARDRACGRRELPLILVLGSRYVTGRILEFERGYLFAVQVKDGA